MACIRIPNGIITITPLYRLRLDDGSCVFMDWHPYCGPTFFRDKHGCRLIDDWHENSLICKALEWFIGRGERA
ncbi:hypothetical protein CRM81_05185 [Yersinia kristensenii]|nr:hypothetical protein [Yersinia enterocolitica]EKN5999530.1 hypothetical protein [Yersinia enterocolitica]PEH52793.1 hypothetical protein CRM81_05185 [Yersinia kristensenii]